MKEILIVAIILFLIFRLGKYALEEGVRIEEQKKFEKDLKAWENGRSKNDPVSIWNKHKRTKK
jgi:hypothetical protein